MSEPKGRDAAWTKERSEEGRRRSEEGWGGGRGPQAERENEIRGL
jgi:hypothetical protein